jgi:hypothetical protein
MYNELGLRAVFATTLCNIRKAGCMCLSLYGSRISLSVLVHDLILFHCVG